MKTDGKIVNLPPEEIQVGDNSRFSILKADVDALKASILEQGEVLVPVEVEPLGKEEKDGKKYRLTTGFRRYQAVTELNKEGAGLTLPAIIRSLTDDKGRLKHQLSENVDRKSLTPMDTAVAIKQMLEAGFSRDDVRATFKRAGGRKGNVIQPASNSFLNMHLSLLDLPKSIQERIHDGRVGIASAYELTRVTPEKRQEVIERAEKSREEAIEKEEREEEKYQAAQGKLTEALGKESEVQTALDSTVAEREITEKAIAAKEEEAAAAYKALKQTEKGKDKEAKKAAKEAFTALEADVKGLQKKLKTLQAEEKKQGDAKVKVAETAAELRKRLEDARKPVGKPKAKAVGPSDIKRAAKEAGAETGLVPLKVSDIRKIVEELALGSEKFPKVSAIGAALKKCFDGVTTPGQMIKELAAVVGETATKSAKK